jgi:alpha-L-fucosidase
MLAAMLSSTFLSGQQGLPPKDTPASSNLAPISKGPFVGTLESLKGNRYPKWFTEGKLGIWAHWGPQAVPMEGDWYARLMYEEGSKDYKDHVARFGHPSQKGYKDIIPLWKAEKWDPDRLMGLYKAAGAKYFVSMGAHHDNFDLWNSTYHRWNAVNMGPHRDVVGDWQKAARKHGLRFGVSEHLGASWTWFQKSRGADKNGPLAGIPYDGADPAFDDLYHPQALPGDTGWYSTDPRWHHEWYRRVKDVVDQYHPDLLYSDGPLPFGEIGASIVAHLYNVNPESVYACKQPSDGRWAQDVERGVLAEIAPHPWQIDTSIGDWYYNKNWKYRGADWVIHTLVDVVSKNGNLLINVVQRPDGSLDPEAEQVLAEMASWMKVNGESIYGTRPWLVFGEGPTRARGGAFKEDFGFSAKDVRYASKGEGTVYATLMGRPEGREITLAALGKREGDEGTVSGVSLLGSRQKVEWSQGPDGLHVTLPAETFSDIATVLKVRGRRLRGFKSIPVPAPAAKRPAPTVTGDASGIYQLKADLAEVPEGSIQVETKDGIANLGYWDNPDAVSWNVDFAAPGGYEVVATVAAESGSRSLEIEVGGVKRSFTVPSTGAWDKFVAVTVGTFQVSQAGKTKVTARPSDPATWRPMNLRALTFRKVG